MFSAWRGAREAYDLGKTLMRATERGRKLHPWQGRRHSMDALISEVDELRVAVVSRTEDNIRAEALDVCVVAIRLMVGR